jgi:hypothetical protein
MGIDLLRSWQQTYWNPWCNLQHFCRHCTRCWFPHGMRTITCVSFNHIQLFLSTNWHCAYQRWHSHLSQHYHYWPYVNKFTSSTLCNLRISCIGCNSNQGKELSKPTPHWSIPPLSRLKYLVVYTNMPMCFYTTMLIPFGAWRGQKAFIFLPWSFFFVKSFDHITNVANIFHLKSSDSRRLSYFPTSTPSKHTSHHYSWPITSYRFLTCKYGWPSTSGWLWSYIDFHSNFEPTWRPVAFPFSFILFLCTFH